MFKFPFSFVAGTKAKAQQINENFEAAENEINNTLLPGVFESGDLKPTARAAAPSGWLMCEGQAVSRTTYASLFAAIGTAYGAGNGSTTFNVPDYRGSAPFGPDSGAGRLTSNNQRGQRGGHEKLQAHTHGPGNLRTGVESERHTHNVFGFSDTRHEGTGFAYPNYDSSPGAGNSQTDYNNSFHTHAVDSGETSAAGEGNAQNMPPYQCANWLVKT